MQTWDNTERYGTVSRVLHWGMGLVILWQLLTVLARVFFDDESALYGFFWGTHRETGLLIFLLVLLRGVWALANLSRRPPSVSLPAKLGHITLYLLMIVIPFLALLRQYGSGRAFEPFGIPLFPGFEGDSIDWMMAPATLFHSWAGYLLFSLIIGHAAMAIWRRRDPEKQDVLSRMW
ncbi:cytochrome b561 [Natronospira proteinivora]|uniref:Cytochrome b561 n=1 Tax=Natronospira proteinivora TaxID=1807133 RepID=A0ABT1G7X8_9GAMM|nr:cytochrome b [Natronospira proteinivora]MCP1727409.1 cytochrome b561 [Natronospira proteinivora]